MPQIINFGLFLAASVLLIVTPGPDMMYVIARGMGQGRKAGLLSALGVCTGLLLHVLAAALGLSALLRTSLIAYSIIKYVGAAYLVYLGVRALLNQRQRGEVQRRTESSGRRIYLQGVLSNVLNPKIALFFLAFLPQFSPTRGTSTFIPMLFLGLTFTALGIVWLASIACLSGSLGRWLSTNRRASRVMRSISGIALIGLGVRIALARRT
ncbi:LysE family translocator [Candidatus Bipolaricaulota bacterium]